MTIDQYSPCPGGKDKKIKFCCHDLVAELDKIERMLDGKQVQAAGDYVTRLLQKYPDRQCLLVSQARLKSLKGADAEAQQAVQRLRELDPNNLMAAIEEAAETAMKGELLAAITAIHACLDRALDAQLPDRLIEGLLFLSRRLFASPHFLANISHLELMVTLFGDDRFRQTLRDVYSDRDLPVVFKHSLFPLPLPEDAPGKAAAQPLEELWQKLRWLRSRDGWAEFVQQWPQTAEGWWNLACCQGRMGEETAAAASLRTYAAIPTVPFDLAAEALAIAMSIEPNTLAEAPLRWETTAPVLDGERLLEKLADHPRLVRGGTNQEETPPPIAVYLAFDREPRPEDVSCKRVDELPRFLCLIQYFGKETDREARLHVATEGNAAQQQVRDLLADLGDCLGPIAETSSENPTPWLDPLLHPLVRMPEDLPLPDQQELLRRYLAERSPELLSAQPLRLLDGKSAQEVAGDPAYARRLAGYWVYLLWTTDRIETDLPLDGLRAAWKLPPPERLSGLLAHPCQLYRRATDGTADDLFQSFALACYYAFERPKFELGRKLLEILPAAAHDRREQVCHYLLQVDPSRSKEYLDMGRAAADTQGKSTGPWDLLELRWCMQEQHIEGFWRMLEHLLTEHRHERDILLATTQVMQAVGLIDEDGQPRSAARPAQVAPAKAGELWKPESAQPAATGKLWVPGME